MYEPDGAAHIRIRRDVPDHHAPGATRESAVGNEPHRFAHAFAEERTGGCEDLAHAGTALDSNR